MAPKGRWFMELITGIRPSRLAFGVTASLILILAIAPAAQSRSGVNFGTTVSVLDLDDCKKGGWAQYSVFKNQGDCVSYVATGGRNQPSGSSTSTSTTTTATTVSTTTTTTTAVRNLPTSKDQCKKGGWAGFGVFKNQGDCVSYVATGGTNPPDGA